MDIQELPQVRNSGFHAKSLTITYQKPVETDEDLGVIPADGVGPRQADGFVASSKDNPILVKGYACETVHLNNPKLDVSGSAEMETITETFRVPGPKAEALAGAAESALLAAIVGAVPGMLVTGLGILGCLAGGANGSSILDLGFPLMIGGASVGGGIGLWTGLSDAWKDRDRVNTLEWKETPIEHSTLRGYQVWGRPNDGDLTETLFSPIVDTKKVGHYFKPVKNYSDW